MSSRRYYQDRAEELRTMAHQFHTIEAIQSLLSLASWYDVQAKKLEEPKTEGEQDADRDKTTSGNVCPGVEEGS